jgi:hypothetical protein
VDTNDLKKWQPKRIGAALGPAVGYLYRLRRRMELTGFPPEDPLYQLVVGAFHALHCLANDLDYRTCTGVFRLTPPVPLRENTAAPKCPPIGPNDRRD